MNVDFDNIITLFEYDKVLTYDPFDGYRSYANLGFKYKFHVKKIGKQNLVLFIEEISPTDVSNFLCKYKAKLHKQKWRFNRKSGEQISFDESEISKKLDEVMAELILLG